MSGEHGEPHNAGRTIPPSAAFRQHFVVYKEIESRGARRRRAERSEVLHEGRALAYPSCSIRFAFVTLGLYPHMGGARARSRLRRERATARLRRAARCSDFARTAACAAMLSFCTNLSTPPIFLPPAAAFRQHFVVYKEIESRGARRRRAERSEVLHEGRALAYPSCSIRFAFVTLGLYPHMGGARARSRLRRERATARLRRAARRSDFARTAACAAMLSPCTQKRR